MGLTTYTRKDIRRMLGRRLRLPFYLRFGSYKKFDAGCTTTLLLDSDLTQEDGFWEGSFIFISDSEEDCNQEWRMINNFLSSGDQIELDYPLSAAPAAEDEYEIISMWNPEDVHDAINQAIESCWPHFFETVVEDTIVLESLKKEYSLSDLSKTPWMITKLWLEGNNTGSVFTAASSGNDSVTAPSNCDLSNVKADWLVSIYEGTGSGQLRTVDSVTGQAISITENWTTNPDTTSKIRFWNPADQTIGWYMVRNFGADRKEFPDNLHLQSLYSSSYGLRLRIEYLSKPELMDDDTDTTVVPSEYLLYKAMSILYSQLNSDNRIDMSTFERLSQRYAAEAEDLKNKLAFRIPTITYRTYSPDRDGSDRPDPMNWS